MQVLDGIRGIGHSGLTLTRCIMLLISLLLAPLVLAAEAQATDLVVNIIDNEEAAKQLDSHS